MMKRGTTSNARGIAVEALLDGPFEQRAVQKDQRNVAGLVEHPPCFGIRRRMDRCPGTRSADPSPL